MIISLGCDHAGFPMKATVVTYLESLGITIIDHGSYNNEPVDFPDVAKSVCASVLEGHANRGIMVCGTGVGASIAANKIPGIRAAVCHDIHSAHQCVEHDDVNIMCIGAKIVGEWLIKDLIKSFLEAEFGTGEDVRRRVDKLHTIELESAKILYDKIK